MSAISPSIQQFVFSDPLFIQVVDKEKQVTALNDVSLKGEKLDALGSWLQDKNSSVRGINLLDSDILDAALLLHMKREIADFQIGTLFSFASAMSLFHAGKVRYKEVIFFSQGGEMDPVVENLTRRMMEIADKNHVFHPILNEKRHRAWIKKMEQKPPTEQRCFLYPLDQDEADIIDIMDAAYHIGHFNIFNRVKYKGKTYRVVPSMGMWDALVDVIGGVRARVFCLGAGESAWFKGKRVISLDSSYASTPDKADGHFAFFQMFGWHDCYHYVRICLIPQVDIRINLALAEYLKRCREFQQDPELLKPLIEDLYDMELTTYQNENAEDIAKYGFKAPITEKTYWYSIHHILYGTYARECNPIVIKVLSQFFMTTPSPHSLKALIKVGEEINEALGESFVICHLAQKVKSQWFLPSHGRRTFQV